MLSLEPWEGERGVLKRVKKAEKQILQAPGAAELHTGGELEGKKPSFRKGSVKGGRNSLIWLWKENGG